MCVTSHHAEYPLQTFCSQRSQVHHCHIITYQLHPGWMSWKKRVTQSSKTLNKEMGWSLPDIPDNNAMSTFRTKVPRSRLPRVVDQNCNAKYERLSLVLTFKIYLLSLAFTCISLHMYRKIKMIIICFILLIARLQWIWNQTCNISELHMSICLFRCLHSPSTHRTFNRSKICQNILNSIRYSCFNQSII